MDELERTIAVSGILFLAALARSTLGFGDALIAMPFLAMLVPVDSATPIVTMVSVFNAMTVLFTDWKLVDFRSASVLIFPGIAAIPFGFWFLKSVSPNVVLAVLAVVVLCFSVWSLGWARERAEPVSERWSIPYGVAAGLLGGAYNTAGPPLVMFGTLRRWNPHQFRATLQGYFMIAGAFALVVHSVGGNVSVQTVQYFTFSIPLILVATVIGRRIANRIPHERFIRVIHVVLLIVGLNLLGVALWN